MYQGWFVLIVSSELNHSSRFQEPPISPVFFSIFFFLGMLTML